MKSLTFETSITLPSSKIEKEGLYVKNLFDMDEISNIELFILTLRVYEEDLSYESLLQ